MPANFSRMLLKYDHYAEFLQLYRYRTSKLDRSPINFLGVFTRHQLPLRVNLRRFALPKFWSASGGKADEIGGKADIAILNVCCWGVSRRTGGMAQISESSHKRSFDNVNGGLDFLDGSPLSFPAGNLLGVFSDRMEFEMITEPRPTAVVE